MTFDLIVTISMHFYEKCQNKKRYLIFQICEEERFFILGPFVSQGTYFGFKILNFNIFFGIFRKLNIFVGMKILWILFWGSSQNWTIFRGHFYAFYGLF